MPIAANARGFVRWLQGERRTMRGGGRRVSDREPNRGWIMVLAIAIPVALADWLVKWLVIRSVPLYGFELLWSDHVALWHVKNPALILGLHGDLPLALRKTLVSAYAVLSVIFLLGVLSRGHRLLPHRRKWVWLFLGLVVGGMVGNLGERALHWGITDFLSFRWGEIWLPPGNLADLSILISLPLAIAVVVFELEARGRRAVKSLDPAPVEDGSAASLRG